MRISGLLAAAAFILCIASGSAWAMDGGRAAGNNRGPGLRRGQQGQRHMGKRKAQKAPRFSQARAGAERGRAAMKARAARPGMRCGRSGAARVMAQKRARMMQGRGMGRQMRGAGERMRGMRGQGRGMGRQMRSMAGRGQGQGRPGMQAGRGQWFRHLGQYFQQGRGGQEGRPGMQRGGPQAMRGGLGRPAGDRAGDARKKIEEFLKNRRKNMEQSQRRGR